MKYVNYGIVFQEIPDEVTLSINISNCPCRCPGCHSSYLWEDCGEELNEEAISHFMDEYAADITCICMMGGDATPEEVNNLASFIKEEYPQIKVGWYSGRSKIPQVINKTNFDYVKVGPYIKHLGALKDKRTNQRLYRINDDETLTDITHLFWKK